MEIFKSYGCPFELMHCNSSYPMANEEANLNTISTLRERYQVNVGYSGHERGIQISIAATALGATSIERHITVDRSMYGSDQAASLALGDGTKRIYESEMPAREKLSTPHWYKLALENNEPKS